jgi:glycerophosphoryl diester phosphodiesterase
VTSTSTERRPLLLGHRGARRQAHENTLAAFELSLLHGCDGFEFDVRLTADQRAVVSHDPKLAGMEIGRAKYRQLSTREPSACCLEDVLKGFSARAWLDIELKVAGLEQSVIAGLKANSPQCGYVISSFLPEVLHAMHACDPGIPLGLICDDRRVLPLWRELPIVGVFPHHRLVSTNLIEQVHGAGKKILVWTVNEEKEMFRLADWDVDGIISDDTELLARAFGRNPRPSENRA